MGELIKTPEFTVGDRIENDGYYGTIRYIGHLNADQPNTSKPKNTVWVGVEWDNPARGKHDGSYNGTRYFSTEFPASGSFLRPEKCNVGMYFMAAMAERYGDDKDAVVDLNDMHVCGRNQQTTVTAVGLEKVMQRQSCFSQLRSVSLRGMHVRVAGNPGEIAPNAVRLEELDISQNLMRDWADVAAVTSQMPRLKTLNVSESRLRLPDNFPDDVGSAFSHVESLYVNRMSYNWAKVSRCATLCPSLDQLHACFNNIRCIDSILPKPFDQLSLINLEGNTVTDWTSVLAFSELPRLTTFILNDCGFATIQFPGKRCDPTTCFPVLSSLSISGNQISEWSSIDELNRLKSLTNLRFVHNPLSLAAGIAGTRHMAIAKIARLLYYNGTQIENQWGERKGAEIDYLRTFGQAWKAAGGTASGSIPNVDFLDAHPRYMELIRARGAPEDSEMEPAPTSALKNNLVSVRIVSSRDHPPLVKKLPVKMTVQKLKALVQRGFNITDSSKMQILYIHRQVTADGNANSGALPGTEEGKETVNMDTSLRIELDNDLRELGFYSLQNDAVLLVEW